MKERIRTIVEDNSTRAGRIFDYFIQSLIFISLVSFSIETLPNLSENLINILHLIEYSCVILFSFEYVLRIIVSNKPLKYITSFYGLIDLVAILPFYLTGSVDLRALRIFRIFRIFRSLKLIRYNKALNRFGVAARIVREEIILFFIVTCIFIFIASSGIYFFESQAQPEIFTSVFHSMWWAIVTLTTVGYGDVYPITLGGKIFTFFILIIGIGVVTVPAGLIATALSKAREIENDSENQMPSTKKGT